MRETRVADDRYPGLRDAREIERFGPYLRELWCRRQWAWYVASSDLKSRQINSLLGNLWHVLSPLLQVGVFFIIFGLVLETDRGVDNFIGYLAVGIFVYLFTQRTVLAGGKSMTKYKRLMQMVSFPRALVPITSTAAEALATIPAYGVMFVIVVVSGEPPQASWALVLPLFVMQSVLTAGLALVAARAVDRIFDIQQVLPFLFRLGFYASGVLFNVNAYLDGNRWRVVFELNPLYCFIESYRSAVLGGRAMDWSLVGIAAVWTVVVAVFGLVWFRAGEDGYGSDV